MKIAKKFMALALAAVLSVGCAFCVSADGSRTKDVTVSPGSSPRSMRSFRRSKILMEFKDLQEAVSGNCRSIPRKLEKARWI